MEDPRHDDRKRLLKRTYCIFVFNYYIAQFQDPIKKREEFSISLRKKKK